jgi:hypothetical protein
VIADAIKDKLNQYKVKALDKLHDAESDAIHKLMVNLPPEKNQKPITTGERLAWGTGSAAGAYLLSKHLFKMKMPMVAAITGISFASGYNAPDASAIISKEKTGDISKDDAKTIFRQQGRQEHQIKDRIVTIINRHVGDGGIDKEAASIFPLLGVGAKFGLRAAGAVGRGMLPYGKGATLGQKVWGTAVKGGAILGAGYAVKKGISNTMNSSKPNYNTFLRNNMLAGNISTDQVNDSDMAQVNKIGLR